MPSATLPKMPSHKRDHSSASQWSFTGHSAQHSAHLEAINDLIPILRKEILAIQKRTAELHLNLQTIRRCIQRSLPPMFPPSSSYPPACSGEFLYRCFARLEAKNTQASSSSSTSNSSFTSNLSSDSDSELEPYSDIAHELELNLLHHALHGVAQLVMPHFRMTRAREPPVLLNNRSPTQNASNSSGKPKLHTETKKRVADMIRIDKPCEYNPAQVRITLPRTISSDAIRSLISKVTNEGWKEEEVIFKLLVLKKVECELERERIEGEVVFWGEVWKTRRDVDRWWLDFDWSWNPSSSSSSCLRVPFSDGHAEGHGVVLRRKEVPVEEILERLKVEGRRADAARMEEEFEGSGWRETRRGH